MSRFFHEVPPGLKRADPCDFRPGFARVRRAVPCRGCPHGGAVDFSPPGRDPSVDGMTTGSNQHQRQHRKNTTGSTGTGGGGATAAAVSWPPTPRRAHRAATRSSSWLPGWPPARTTPTPCWPGWPAWNCGAGSPRPAGPTGPPCPCRPPSLRRSRTALQEAVAVVLRHAQNVALSSGRPGLMAEATPAGSGASARPRPVRGRDAADPGRSGRAQFPVRGAAGRSIGPGRDRAGAGGRGRGGGSRAPRPVPVPVRLVHQRQQRDYRRRGGRPGRRPRPDGAGESRRRSPGEPPGVRVRGGAEHPAPADRPDRPGVRAPVEAVRPASGHAARHRRGRVRAGAGEAGAAAGPARRPGRGRRARRRRPGRGPRIGGRSGPGVPAPPAGPDHRQGNPDARRPMSHRPGCCCGPRPSAGTAGISRSSGWGSAAAAPGR